MKYSEAGGGEILSRETRIPYPGSKRHRSETLTWMASAEGTLVMTTTVQDETGEAGEGQRTNIRVLLVDDEREFLALLAERLEARGLEVTKAFNGDHALVQLKDKGADVVILDIEMPGRNGISTLREIKRTMPLTQVIMLTGLAPNESANQCFESGAYDFLTKPTDIKELIERIVSACGSAM